MFLSISKKIDLTFETTYVNNSEGAIESMKAMKIKLTAF
jgi:hypothetical protein